MTNRARIFPRAALFASLAIAFAASGCGSSDDGAAVAAEDRLTDAERAAGEAWTEQGDDAPPPGETIDPGAAADGDAALAPDDAVADPDLGAPELGPMNEPESCRAATGYRRGVAFRICVVTVDGKPVEQGTAAAYLRMQAAARRAGVSIRVVSGFRTMEEQRRLYALYKAGRGNLAAPPGYSNHQSGHALDLNTSAAGVYGWLTRHAGAYGFRRTVPSEKWHWEH
jgi:hypothetical protein